VLVMQSHPDATAVVAMTSQEQWRHSNNSGGSGGVWHKLSAEGARVAEGSCDERVQKAVSSL